MIPGYEADDVIGTIAKMGEKEGFTVYMVTPDKDLGQLISENILQYKPGKSGAENEILGKKEICEKYGMKLGYVNKALILYPLRVPESPVWITYFSCKDCKDYMIESRNCFKTKLCKVV